MLMSAEFFGRVFGSAVASLPARAWVAVGGTR